MEERIEYKQKESTTKKLPVAAVICIDIFLVLVILIVFFIFKAVLPAVIQAKTVPLQTPAPTPVEQAASLDTPEPDTRTEWQRKFEGHFSDTVISGENSYISPEVSIQIETHTIENEMGSKITYHIADIYIASMDNFKTYTARNEMKYYSTQNAVQMDIDSGAIIAINGDFYSFQSSGLLVRNGVVYKDDYVYCDICVMFGDGSMEMYGAGQYDKDEILSRSPMQIWNFGPSLLDENGKAKTSFETSSTVSDAHPRSAMGYYEPGHYCFVLVDGRQQDYSAGMTLQELAALFEQLGCLSAYNMDGGASAIMTFNDDIYNSPSNGGREIGDSIIIVEGEGR